MALKSLYKDYFQKSKVFLYPQLEIRRGVSITPIQTYIALENIHSPEDMKLVCEYYTRTDPEFYRFEKNKLLGNKYFEDFKQIDTASGLYIFDFQSFAQDWNNFLLGKYSKLNASFKNRIKDYYGKENAHFPHIESYLDPEKYYEEYAKLLDVPVKELKTTGELCSPPDFALETSRAKIKLLNLVNE